MGNTTYYHERKTSLRLSGHDYSSAGYYFVTICIKTRENFFGEIINDVVRLSDIGCIALEQWLNLPMHFPDVELDEFIVMPNHIHGIIVKPFSSREDLNSERWKSLNLRKPSNLSVIVGSYKSGCTKIINRIQDEIFFSWQRGFYEEIIRNEKALYNIRRYIKFNPLNWKQDENFRATQASPLQSTNI